LLCPKIISESPGHTRRKTRRALAEDEKDITGLLRNILKSEEMKERVIELSGGHAEEFMALLQTVALCPLFNLLAYSQL
jgi:hypothetical protein